MKILRFILKAIVIVSIIGVVEIVATKVYDSWVHKHCKELVEQSIEQGGNPYFYITELDYNECNSIGISINAPIYE